MAKSSIVFAAFAALILSAGTAFAHAHLRKAAPAVGSTVHGSPAAVTLWFSEALEPKFSSIQVLDKDGKSVDKGDVAAVATDKTALIVSLPALAPGTYQVVWHATSVDTHKTQGNFTFTVAP